MATHNGQSPLERLGFNQADADRLLAESQEFKGESLWTDARRRLKKNRVATWSLRFLILFALMSFFAPLLPLRQPAEQNLPNQLQPPAFAIGDSDYLPLVEPDAPYDRDKMDTIHGGLSFFDHILIRTRLAMFGRWQTGHWMGTDAMGRDVMSRIVWGSRTSINVALMATLCSLLIGVLYGAFSGLMGGRIDNLMMRIVDVLYSIPFIFVVIGAVYWLTMARVVRGQVLSLKNKEFVEAARVVGASVPRILLGHIVPNVLSIVIIYLTLTIPAVMLFEAFLSFLGLGIEAPKVSWGTLASDSTKAINPLRVFWWLVLFPSLAMGSTLLALNLLGDGLRDALDPKMRGKE